MECQEIIPSGPHTRRQMPYLLCCHSNPAGSTFLVLQYGPSGSTNIQQSSELGLFSAKGHWIILTSLTSPTVQYRQTEGTRWEVLQYGTGHQNEKCVCPIIDQGQPQDFRGLHGPQVRHSLPAQIRHFITQYWLWHLWNNEVYSLWLAHGEIKEGEEKQKLGHVRKTTDGTSEAGKVPSKPKLSGSGSRELSKDWAGFYLKAQKPT